MEVLQPLQSPCNLYAISSLGHYKTLIPGPWTPLNWAMGHFLKGLNPLLEISVLNTYFFSSLRLFYSKLGCYIPLIMINIKFVLIRQFIYSYQKNIKEAITKEKLP